MKPTIATLAIAAVLAATMPAHAVVTSPKQTNVVSQAWSAVKAVGRAIGKNNGATGQPRESGHVAGMRSLDRMFREQTITEEFYRKQMAYYGRLEKERRANEAANNNMVQDRPGSKAVTPGITGRR